MSEAGPPPSTTATSATTTATATTIPRPARARVWLAFVVLVLVLAGLFALGWLPRQGRAAAQHAAAGQQVLRVRVTTGRPAPAVLDLRLPGSVEAMRATTVHARSNGYVRAWHADLGDHVKAGQLLVELDAPEMTHQLAEAQAGLARAQAAHRQVAAYQALAALQLQRAKTLGTLTSQQDIDIRQAGSDAEAANLEAAAAAITSAEANVARLLQLKSFSRVLAPFAGTVVERSVEVGELVTAGSGSGANALLRIAQTDPVRVVVAVPQSSASAITPGMAARIVLTGAPAVAGTVSHLARALDPITRTMRAEIQATNASGLLMPGMYVQVELSVANQHQVLMLNANALISGSNGPQVAVVGTDGIARLTTVAIELDTGGEIGVGAGVTASDRVMLNPPAGLEDGTAVEVLPTPAAKASTPSGR